MNTIPAIKLVGLSSCAALAGLAAFILGIALDAQPLSLFACFASTLVLLIAAGDYAPRPAQRRSSSADLVPFAPAPAPSEATEKLAA